MSRAQEQIDQLKPKLDAAKLIVEELQKKQAELHKAQKEKTAIVSKRTITLTQNLRTEASSQSMLLSSLPSSRNVAGQLQSLRGARDASMGAAAALRKANHGVARLEKELTRLNMLLAQKQALYMSLHTLVTKLQAEAAMQKKRKEQNIFKKKKNS